MLSLYTSPVHPIPTGKQAIPEVQGVLLIAILLDSWLFGFVSQQFYGYWFGGFKDSSRLKLFIVVQYIVVVFQAIMTWHTTYYRYVSLLFVPPSTFVRSNQWDASISSTCQLILILHANVFLALRIFHLTNSIFQSGLVIALSIIAFVLGMATTVEVWKNVVYLGTTRKILTIVWHAIQALAECLITFFLVRVLLLSRSGFRRSDGVVNYLVRSAIQTGCLATAWAIASLVSCIFLPHNLVYRIFDATSGSVYTLAVFDTLISRAQLREKMLQTTFELEWTTVTLSEPDRSPNPSRMIRASLSGARVRSLVSQSLADPGSSPTSKSDAIETHPGTSAALYEISSHQASGTLSG